MEWDGGGGGRCAGSEAGGGVSIHGALRQKPSEADFVPHWRELNLFAQQSGSAHLRPFPLPSPLGLNLHTDSRSRPHGNPKQRNALKIKVFSFGAEDTFRNERGKLKNEKKKK